MVLLNQILYACAESLVVYLPAATSTIQTLLSYLIVMLFLIREKQDNHLPQ